MYTVRYGGRSGTLLRLEEASDLLAVRTNSRRLVTQTGQEAPDFTPRARRAVADLESVFCVPAAGVEVVRTARGPAARTALKRVLNREADVQFAGRVLVSNVARQPVLYTENFFVKFAGNAAESRCRAITKAHGLTVKRELTYAPNAFFVAAREGTGRKVFALAEALLRDPLVELCHPELMQRARKRLQAFPSQWHLAKCTIGGKVIDQHASVEDAWAVSQGQGITIAIIDDGVDIDHAEFSRAGKVAQPRDVTRRGNDPRPGSGDFHGTACAGVACADGRTGAAGVAPLATLMPIRCASALGSQAEADAFVWAAEHGADIVSCSWGPEDGDWWDPADARHKEAHPLPDSTRLAIDFAATQGRGGKGCFICFAAGNGNESVDLDGYASYEKVTAIAACNDSGKRSNYSDFGNAVWCSFPSSELEQPVTPGIWTTDRRGAAGYNAGRLEDGDVVGDYTNSFGGTSSSCPGAAGIAALVLARNPGLRWNELRELLKQSCERIDPSGAQYKQNGHSRFLGYGRLNAKTAVTLAGGATPPTPTAVQRYVAQHQATLDLPIPDRSSVTLPLEVGDTRAIAAVRVYIEIEHTYIGDLVVKVVPPSGTGRPVTLHNRSGGSARNLKRTYDQESTPGLSPLVGRAPTGTWALEVADKIKDDVGRLVRWGVELEFTDTTPRAATRAVKEKPRSVRRPKARR